MLIRYEEQRPSYFSAAIIGVKRKRVNTFAILRGLSGSQHEPGMIGFRSEPTSSSFRFSRARRGRNHSQFIRSASPAPGHLQL
jgi:hypothetical protein